MSKVKINPGPCGFEAIIQAKALNRQEVSMTVTSDCPGVTAMAEALETLSVQDILGKEGFGGVRPFQAAAEHLAHAACPVLSGFLKAAEVELGLAVPRSVTIEFLDQKDS